MAKEIGMYEMALLIKRICDKETSILFDPHPDMMKY